MVLVGLIILLYKDSGFWGFGGYIDKSWENIIICLTLFISGFLLTRWSKFVTSIYIRLLFQATVVYRLKLQTSAIELLSARKTKQNQHR